MQKSKRQRKTRTEEREIQPPADVEYLEEDVNEKDVFEDVVASLAADPQWASFPRTQYELDSISATRDENATIKSTKQPVKRRRRRNVDENDPRKYYLDNVVNAINGGDQDEMWRVFQAQFTEDVVQIHRQMDDTPDVAAYREIRGIHQLFEYTTKAMEAIPDGVIVVTSRKLHVRTDDTSYLVAKLNFSGLYLFNIITTNVIHTARNFLSRWNPFSMLYNLVNSVTRSFEPTEQSSSNRDDESAASDNAKNDSADKMDVEVPSNVEETVVKRVEFRPAILSTPAPARTQSIEPSSRDAARIKSMSVDFGPEDFWISASNESVDHTSSSAMPQAEVDRHLAQSLDIDWRANHPTSVGMRPPMLIPTGHIPVEPETSHVMEESFSSSGPKSSLEVADTLTNMEEGKAKSPRAESYKLARNLADNINFTEDRILVNTPASRFIVEKTPRKQPFRLNCSITYVAHINADHKIYKEELFRKINFNVDWWGNRTQNSNSDDEVKLEDEQDKEEDE